MSKPLEPFAGNLPEGLSRFLERLFGNPEDTERWARTPHDQLNYDSPAKVWSTDERRVKDLVARIVQGVSL